MIIVDNSRESVGAGAAIGESEVRITPLASVFIKILPVELMED
jgi:hypothetical protein